MTTPSRPWPRGAATGVGSLPGVDPREAARTVLGELPDLPYLPELPARGPGADLTGRTAALLVDLPVEIVPSGWRVAGRPGRDLRRARDLLARDLDALEEAAPAGPTTLKFQSAGPWTLAATVELPNGHRVVSDHGAVRDLAESLAEGLREHARELARRLPGTLLVGQIDEPALPAVLAGTLPTASGWGTVRHVDRAVVRDTLRDVLAALPGDAPRVVHCCAGAPPVGLFREAGATGLAVDLDRLDAATTDDLGEALDAGVPLLAGVVPGSRSVGAVGEERIGYAAMRDRLLGWWNTLGFPRAQLADLVVPTAACGLAGSAPARARAVTAALRDAGRALADLD